MLLGRFRMWSYIIARFSPLLILSRLYRESTDRPDIVLPAHTVCELGGQPKVNKCAVKLGDRSSFPAH